MIKLALLLCLPALALASPPDRSPREQTPGPGCPDRGSRWVAARWTEGPPLTQCLASPHAPAWRIHTPAHREAVPRPGYRVVRARQLPRLIVRYRCTGLWLHPVVVHSVRTLGYVFDVVDTKCD